MAHSMTIWKKKDLLALIRDNTKKRWQEETTSNIFLLNSLSKVDVSIICTVDFENDML